MAVGGDPTESAGGVPAQPFASRRDKLRFEPEQGTTEGYDEEGGIRFYESSLAHTETGERLLTVVSVRRGMRLTNAQARELYEWLGAWLDAA